MHPFARLAALGLAAALVALFAPAAGAVVAPFWFFPLERDAVDDSHPRISGHNVVWQHDTGSAAEIWFRNDQHFFPLTQDAFADELPEIDGNTVVWQHDDGSDYEIMRSDEVSNQFVTNNTGADNCPVPSNGSIGWRGTGALGPDFFIDPGVPTQQVTGDKADDECPRGSAGNFVWSKHDLTSGDRDIWAWLADLPTPPGPGLYQITDTPAVMESSPAISKDRIVYVRGTGSAADIRLFDAADFSDVPLISDGSEDRNPQIDGDRIVWEHFDGGDWEIYEYQVGGALTPVTNNAVNDHDPQVSGDTIVWVADEPGHSQIWVAWHGGAPQRLTNDPVNHESPQIDGDLIAFQSCPSTCDIWLSPEPTAGGLALAALGTLAALARRR